MGIRGAKQCVSLKLWIKSEWAITFVLLPFRQRQEVLFNTVVSARHLRLWGSLEHFIEFNDSHTFQNLLLWWVPQGVAVLVAQLPVDFHIRIVTHDAPRSEEVVERHVPFVRLTVLQVRQITSHVDHVEVGRSIFERLSRRSVPATLDLSTRGMVVVPIAPVVAAAGIISTFGTVVGGVATVINVSWRSRWTVMATAAGS